MKILWCQDLNFMILKYIGKTGLVILIIDFCKVKDINF